jgi:hypothetical protein
MLNVKRTVAAGTLAALAASLAMTASADATTYYACVKKRGGRIRLVSRAAKCKRSERKISFNSAGVPGKNGVNGRNGLNGKNGASGLNGTNGANGTNGTTGFTSTLPKGESEVGTWGALPNGTTAGYSAISFNIPLANAPAVTITEANGEPPKPPCLGTVAKPTAESGHLCVYIDTSHFGGSVGLLDPATGKETAETYGTLVAVVGAPMDGTWAVTG